MFDSFTGLPLHALVVHLVVVAVPLCLLLAVLFVTPRFRAWSRWALAVVAVGTLVSTFIARASGDALYIAANIAEQEAAERLIARHGALAIQLIVITSIFSVLALACAFLVGGRDREGVGPARNKTVGLILCAAMLVAAVLASIWVVRVGDLGTRALWNPTGEMSYEVGN
jgi:hypothetical protein